MTGDKAAWAPRIEQGREKLLANAINGIGKMPARGGDSSLSDDDIKKKLQGLGYIS